MLKKITYLLLFILVGILFSFCKKDIDAEQEKENVFVKYFGSNAQEEGIKVVSVKEDGFYILGNTVGTNSNSNIILIKTDKQGNKLWEKNYGTNLNEKALDIKFSHDNNLYIIGNQLNANNKFNIYALKVSMQGDVIWERTYGRTLFNETVHAITTLSDNNFILIGTTDFRQNNDLYYIKISTNGDSLWSRIHGLPTASEYGINSIEKADTLLMFFDSENNATADKSINVIKTTNIGTIFEIVPPIANDNGQKLQQIFWNNAQQTFTGICNKVISAINNSQITFQKISQQYQLSQSIPFSATKSDFANQIIATSDNGYAIIGTTSSYGEGKDDIYLLRIDAGGNKLFYKTYGGIGDDRGYSILQTKDEGFVITGSTEFEGNTMICLIKTNKNGELLPE